MTVDDEIKELTRQIEGLKRRLSEARRRRPAEPVADHVLRDPDGSPVTLSALFGDQEDLIVIHNMGSGCAYCTMWADGLASALPYIESRTALALVSPDDPATLRSFAASRGWPFRLASGAGGDFIREMGFDLGTDGFMPGCSTFHRQPDGGIVRTGYDFFGPGDDYCPPWRLFDLLEGGAGDWEPRFQSPTPHT